MIFANLTQVAPSISIDFDVNLDGTHKEENLTDSNLRTRCFQYDQSKHALVARKGASTTGGASSLSGSAFFALAVAAVAAVFLG